VSFPPTPNQVTQAVIKRGDDGWPVYAVQRALAATGRSVTADGDFGSKTEAKVKAAQKDLGLTADGIAGPKTQRAMCIEVADGLTIHGLPSGLARSLMEGESGYYLSAVNWSIKGGVDCGPMQHRVFGPPYSPQVMFDSYDIDHATRWALNTLDQRAETYFDMPAVKRRSDALEYSIRLGLLAHNWPWAAQELASGRTLSATKEATWVPKGLKFDDGTAVHSYRDWAQFYAMGGPHGEARMTKYVRSWTK